MATDNLGVGVLGAWPFEHDIDVVDGPGDIASTRQLPSTVTLQYQVDTGSALHPYLGAGLTYTTFFDEDVDGASLEWTIPGVWRWRPASATN